ncbi:MAG TPA: DUF1566 domain-containing protein, partial [Spirochaetota bacterium]|nr:DUF1566 domain-containing protein [Spirochaetota bacterium]
NGTVNGAGHSKLSAYRVRAVRSFGPDATAPTLPSGSITAIVAGPDSITLSWNYAEDNSTDQSSLQYRVYYSNSSYKVSTVTACETNGTPAGYYTTNINAKTIPVSLGAPTLCYNVVVRDNSGNKKCYTPKWAGLYSVTYDRNNSDPGGTVPDTGYYANNQMVTVAENTGSLVKMQDGISLRLLWNTNASGLGTSYKPGSGTFAMNETNVTLYAKWEVVGCTGPAEGLIFYDKGNYDDGWRYLEAAPISTEWTSKRWAPPDKTNTYVGVSPKSVGVGKQNTIKIIDKYGNTTNDYAAKLCADLSHDGYNDWFLPSDAELAEVANVRVEGGFSSGTGNLYWSSSEWNNASAYAKDLIYPSSSSSTSKATTYFVRAVRSFGNDATPPTFPSGSDITITGVNSTSVELEWALATDGNGAGGSTLDANLQYRIYYSTSAADVSTVTACETNGTPFGYYNYYSAPAGKTVTGLTGISTGTTYWFNIVVRDNSGNKACYSATSAGLFKVTYHENGDTTGDVPVDNNYYATGQTVTVAGRGTLEKIEDNISLRLIWNTKATGGGTDHTVDVGTFDMPPNNVTLYAKWTALGCTGPAGGLIFYDKGAGNYSDGWRYLEAAPSDQSSGIRWGAKTAVAGATGDGYGAGKQNTINIIAHYGDATEDYAAKLCADLSHDGYNDWFLPSSYELGAMYTKLYKSGVGGFTAEPYWSSSEFGDNAVMRDFGGFGNPPAPTSHSKTNNCRVRAARSFGNDTTPPTVPTASDITADVNSGSVTLSWYIASDNSTYQASLQYRIYYSAYDNISTVEACETNGTPFGYYNYYSSNPASKTVTGLPGGTYYFNVVVRDNSGNKACYTAAGPLNLFKVTYDGNGAASGSAPVDANIYTSGQTVTVLGEGTLAKTHDGINLRVACWNTQSDGMGTDYQPGATFTIGTANVTLYAKWTALKCYGPAGGLIFYDKGNYDNGWRYMEAAPSSAETEWDSKVWGGYGTAVPGADGTTTGSGKQNTIDIVAQYGAAEPHQNKTDYAAKLCADLSYGGYNDWFLPSTSELETMLTLRGDGGFPDNVLYWSSTEVYGDNSNKSIAMEYNTTYNNITSYYKEKHQSYRVRAARSF